MLKKKQQQLQSRAWELGQQADTEPLFRSTLPPLHRKQSTAARPSKQQAVVSPLQGQYQRSPLQGQYQGQYQR